MNLTLYGNPWKCDCAAEKLIKIASINNSYNRENIRCKEDKQLLFQTNFTKICNSSYDNEDSYFFLYIIFGSVLMLSFTVLTICCCCCREKIKLIYNSWCNWNSKIVEDEEDGEIYDAFVCFAHEDEDFVLTELVPKLEKDSKMPFKLCLHSRDWSPGEWVFEQISKSIDRSKKTILVFSNNFLASRWSLSEFRLAHANAEETKKPKVVIILYNIRAEDIIDDIDPVFRTYLQSNSYIQWGDPNFWTKLKKQLKNG